MTPNDINESRYLRAKSIKEAAIEVDIDTMLSLLHGEGLSDDKAKGSVAFMIGMGSQVVIGGKTYKLKDQEP